MEEYLIVLMSLVPLIAYRLTRQFYQFAILSLLVIAWHGVYLFGTSVLIGLALTYIISTIAELTSLKSRFNCFGIRYRYALDHPFFSSRIRLLGVYPLEVSLAWVILKYLSFHLGVLIITSYGLPFWSAIFLVPLVLVALDLVLDPVSVNIAGLWYWERGSGYFGIPYRNFLGWYLVGMISMVPYLFWKPAAYPESPVLHGLSLWFYASFVTRGIRLWRVRPLLATLGTLPLLTFVLLAAYALIFR